MMALSVTVSRVWFQTLMVILMSNFLSTHSNNEKLVLELQEDRPFTITNLSRFGDCFCKNTYTRCTFSDPDLNLTPESAVDASPKSETGHFECHINRDYTVNTIVCVRGSRKGKLDEDKFSHYIHTTKACDFRCIEIYWNGSEVEDVDSSVMKCGRCPDTVTTVSTFMSAPSSLAAVASTPTSLSTELSPMTTTQTVPSPATAIQTLLSPRAIIAISILTGVCIAIIVVIIFVLFFLRKKRMQSKIGESKDMYIHYEIMDDAKFNDKSLSLPTETINNESEFQENCNLGLKVDGQISNECVYTTVEVTDTASYSDKDGAVIGIDTDDVESGGVYARLHENGNNTLGIYDTLMKESTDSVL